MIKKQYLFQLIHSLSKSEKRYFKIFCLGQKIAPNYLQLFEATAAQRQYDEAAIRRQFAGATFLKQLHVAKHYLYRLILKSLRNYHHQSSPAARVRAMLHHVEMLFERELYAPCAAEIRRAQRLAQSAQLLSAQVELAEWQRRLFLAQHSQPDTTVNAVDEAQAQAIEGLRQLNRYWQFSNRIQHYVPDPDERLLRDPLFNRPAPQDNQQAHALHQHTLFSYFLQNGQHERAYAVLREQIAFLEGQTTERYAQSAPYLTALHKQVSYLIRARSYDEAIGVLDKIRRFVRNDSKEGASRSALSRRNLLRTYNVELELYRTTRRTEAGRALIVEVQDFMTQHPGIIPPEYRLMLWYQFAHLQWLHGDLDRALHWTNAIIHERFGPVQEVIQGFARWLHLVIHFELDHSLVLYHAVDQIRRFLKRRRELWAYERVLLRFFSKASRCPKADWPALKTQAQAQLFAGDAPLMDEEALGYFDFREWLGEKA